MFDYLVEFTDKRDKRRYQLVVSINEKPKDESLLRREAGSTTYNSIEYRILRDIIEMYAFVRFENIKIKAICSPISYKEMKIKPITELFAG